MDRPRHILIVDDNGGIRGLLTAALEERGDRVTSAANGTSMRDQLNHERVDVVVLDIRLPGEDGHSLALHAKALRLPVVLISGSDDEIGFAKRHGLQLLRKPFRLPQLFDALDAALASRIYGQRDT
jgi:DNA-binding NtrC family response regulator